MFAPWHRRWPDSSTVNPILDKLIFLKLIPARPEELLDWQIFFEENLYFIHLLWILSKKVSDLEQKKSGGLVKVHCTCLEEQFAQKKLFRKKLFIGHCAERLRI